MKTFDLADFERLQVADHEKALLADFVKDRLITHSIIKQESIRFWAAIHVPDVTRSVPDPKNPDGGLTIHIRESLGGGRDGEDFREHYLPIDYVFGGDAADNALRQSVEDEKRQQIMNARR